jgi:hypothetical protein
MHETRSVSLGEAKRWEAAPPPPEVGQLATPQASSPRPQVLRPQVLRSQVRRSQSAQVPKSSGLKFSGLSFLTPVLGLEVRLDTGAFDDVHILRFHEQQ